MAGAPRTNDSATPWWWLSRDECIALGLGAGARRTAEGVVFGSESNAYRIEVVARRDDAPVKLGSVSLRLWGDLGVARAREAMLAAAKLLSSRRGRGFEPDAAPLAPDPVAPAAANAPEHAGEAVMIEVPSVCERACVFCHVSTRPLDARRARGSDDEVTASVASATGSVTFSGDDALSHPRLAEWVAQAAARGAAPSVIGPPRVRATAALAPALAAAGLRKYITAMFADHAAAHDRIAGLPGAFDALDEACLAMRAHGVTVEFVTPVIAPVLADLGAIAHKAHALSGQPVTLLVYAPEPSMGRGFDALVPSFAAVRDALAALDGTTKLSWDALPLCVIPAAWRASSSRRLSRTDAGVHAMHPPEPCSACDLRAACPGVANTVHALVGNTGLVPLRRSAQDA